MDMQVKTDDVESAVKVDALENNPEYDVLLRQIEELKEKANKMRSEQVADVIAKVKDMIVKYDLTAYDLGLSGSQKGDPGSTTRPTIHVAIKYRDGDNTWTGRGKKPHWVKAIVDSGDDLNKFLVPKN